MCMPWYTGISCEGPPCKWKNRKKRRPRRVWAWLYLQRRVDLGHYDNLMEELTTESPELYRNFTRIDKDLFSEIAELVTPHIQKQRTF